MKNKLALILLPALLLSAAAFFFLIRSRSETRAVPTNLLLITLDTTRADRIGCYGDRLAKTPALDALAKEGVLFENCYSPVPVTLPAHCSLFTGRWPIAHGGRNNGYYKLAEEELTLAEKLRSAGYDTGALVAVYVLKNKFGLAQGFDLYDDRLGYEEKAGNIDAQIPADRAGYLLYSIRRRGHEDCRQCRKMWSDVVGVKLLPLSRTVHRTRVAAGQPVRPG